MAEKATHKTNKKNRSTSKKKKRKIPQGRFRNWSVVMYFDGLRLDEIKAILLNLSNENDVKILCVKHDRDMNEDGTPKKEHYHVLLFFSNKKSYEQVKELLSEYGNCMIELVGDRTAMARYLCHLDNPNKAKYDVEDVIAIGTSYLKEIKQTREQRAQRASLEKSQIEEIIDEYDVILLHQLINILKENYPELTETARKNHNYFLSYIRSREYEYALEERKLFLEVQDEQIKKMKEQEKQEEQEEQTKAAGGYYHIELIEFDDENQ